MRHTLTKSSDSSVKQLKQKHNKHFVIHLFTEGIEITKAAVLSATTMKQVHPVLGLPKSAWIIVACAVSFILKMGHI